MNQTSNKNPIMRALGSAKLTLVILAAFAVSIAVATFLEVRYGAAGARALVYNAHWFEALLALLVVNVIVALIVNLPYRKHQIGYVITHVAFIIVLVGAGITRFFAYEGNMPIREGASTDYIYSSADYVSLQAGTESASFPVRLYKPGRNVLQHDLTIGSERFRVAIDEYWPHMDERLAEGPGGRPVVVFSAQAQSGGHSAHRVLDLGDAFRASGVTVHFVGEEMETEGGGAERGEMVVVIGEETHRMAVPAGVPAGMNAAGYRFRITEFSPDFRVGRTPDPADAMNNPAIRVKIEGPDGTSAERLLFAFHPEFNAGHGDGEQAISNIDLEYRYGRNLYLFGGEDKTLAGIADFDIQVGEGGEIAGAGEKFTVQPGVALHSNTFAILPVAYWESAAETPFLTDDVDKPPAARIVVEDEAGNRGSALVEKWAEGATVDLAGRHIAVAFGPVRIDLPYRLHLDDFVLVTYPGSNNPASFESHVRIYDDERGVDGRSVRIYMNHPLTYRGFKHFQSSYDTDRLGTVLSVNHDPGKLPTYVGYFFVGLGFLVTLTRGIVWNRRPSAHR